MLRPYIPIILVVLFVLANAVLLPAVSHLLSNVRKNPAKDTPYESGMPVLGTGHERFSVKFYMVAMLFILFDVEAIFLYPWAVILKDLKMFGFWEMMVYLGIFLVGFFYVWKKGVLEWGVSAARRGDV